tara:strand:+ start:26 stop:334 length:309 start_codon:yes stop_codon:yes gene_type:complete
MNELTDLQICKNIAEIECAKIDVLGGKAILDEMIGGVRIRLTEYNPLTDDALCFQLMIKHKLEVWEHNGKWLVGHNLRNTIHNENPNKAICLAIIEAHKDQS